MDLMLALMKAMTPNPDREYIKRDGFSISYNPDTDVGAETALIIPSRKLGTLYFVLSDDHREGYAKCECLADARKYFYDNRHLKSVWSD